jgi:hypothetical protein
MVVSIPKGTYNYPTNASPRFVCDARGKGDEAYVDDIEFRGPAAGGIGADIADDRHPGASHPFYLARNCGNPFNPRTTISFNLAAESHVMLEAFDEPGERVGMLVNRTKSASYLLCPVLGINNS